jgi:hypothetical protein
MIAVKISYSFIKQINTSAHQIGIRLRDNDPAIGVCNISAHIVHSFDRFEHHVVSDFDSNHM